jgi:hypothetical protein
MRLVKSGADCRCWQQLESRIIAAAERSACRFRDKVQRRLLTYSKGDVR